MTSLMILFVIGAIAAPLALAAILLVPRLRDNAVIAALVMGAFAGFSAVVVYREGPLGFLPNHTTTLWGTQVWFDLVIALVVALTVLAPRARALGMRVPLWALATCLTGSIGLLAMAARVFWLESRKPAA